MRVIALTGTAANQDAAALYLQAAINGRALPLRLLAGLTQRQEAYVIHRDGGEVWLCGPEAASRDLVGVIDRVLPADDVRTLGTQCVQCLEQFLAKTNITGEPA